MNGIVISRRWNLISAKFRLSNSRFANGVPKTALRREEPTSD